MSDGRMSGPADAFSQRVEEIFHSARQRKPEDCAAYLENACGNDAELRARVEALLEHDERARRFLEEPAIGERFLRAHAETLEAMPAEASEDSAETPSREGMRLGAYLLGPRIATGGMGSIYVAERVDREFRKKVAVKLIKRGMDTDEILVRFRKERQALAYLDHPNVARFLDGGTTEDGSPYLVMELIEGEALDAYCDARKIPTEQRLELFLAVCSAVHYAHSHLIVHRDIKPSNVLVTADGTPKLLDFGIAKLLDPEMTSSTWQATATAHRFFTADYSSPEQIRGEPITTASDVYSLGVVLYELLTGHRPYRLTRRAPQEIERVICEEEPAKPSVAVQRVVEVSEGDTKKMLTPQIVSSTRDGRADTLRRRLVGDVDNIVLKAMRKEPGRRYGSVQQLAEDIRRHLRGLPVSARKDTVRYRTVKFIRRHRVLFVSAALLLLALVGGVVGILFQANRATRERDRAVVNLRRAATAENDAVRRRAWLAFLFSSTQEFEVAEAPVTFRQLLERAVERTLNTTSEDPRRQAQLMENFADLYSSLSLAREAAALRRRVLELHRDVLGSPEIGLAESHLQLGESLFNSGDYQEAEALLIRAQEGYAGQRGNELAVARCLASRGALHRAREDTVLSLRLYRESLKLYRSVTGEPLPDVAECLHGLGSCLLAAGEREEALGIAREAAEMVRQLYQGDHPMVASAEHLLGATLQELSRYDEAESHYRRALAIAIRFFGEDHLHAVLYQLQLAVLLKDRGEYDIAEELARDAVQRRRKLLGEESRLVANALWHLTQILTDHRKFQEAERSCRKALALYIRLQGPENPMTSRAMTQLGRILVDSERDEEAEQHLRDSLRIHRKNEPEHWETAKTASLLGEALTGLGRYKEAEPLLIESYPEVQKNRGAGHLRTREALERVVELYEAWDRPEDAASYRSKWTRVAGN